jgi:hypothetical protein
MTARRLRAHLEAALAEAEGDETRRHLREALQLLEGAEGAADVVDLAEVTGDAPRRADEEGESGPSRRSSPATTDTSRGATAGQETSTGGGVPPAERDVPTTPAALREAFAAVPVVEPTDAERRLLHYRYPSAVVPDDGPVPDPTHTQRVPYLAVLEPWVLAAAAYHVAATPREERTPGRVVDAILDQVQPDATFQTPSGADAVTAILAAAEAFEHGRSASSEGS